MVKYLVMRIRDKKLNYNEVIEKYPDFKSEIDNLLQL